MWFVLTLLFAQEIAKPDTLKAGKPISAYRIVSLTFQMEPDPMFIIAYIDSNGVRYQDVHRGPTTIKNNTGGADTVNPEGADEIMRAINTGNFTNTSLIKRMFEHLVTHGKIPPSTVSGTPQK